MSIRKLIVPTFHIVIVLSLSQVIHQLTFPITMLHECSKNSGSPVFRNAQMSLTSQVRVYSLNPDSRYFAFPFLIHVWFLAKHGSAQSQ